MKKAPLPATSFRSKPRSGKSRFVLAVAASLSMHALQAQAQTTTGFNQTGAGPFDYNTASNWVDNDINGIWDSSLTLTASQITTFSADTTLTTGLMFGYLGNFDETLKGKDGPFTLTLGGDITVAPGSNRTVTFGSATAAEGLNVDLGGVSRLFTVNISKTLKFMNAISNGDFTVTGGGTMRFSGNGGAAASSDIEVNSNSVLMFDSSSSGVVGTTRAQSVTLKSGGKVSVNGNNTANSVDAISGALVVDGSALRTRSSGNSISNVTVSPGGSRNTLLTIGSLQRATNGVILFRGGNLGANSIASATAGSSNIQITGTAPALVGGGGAAGSTNISIIPWAIGGSTTGDAGSTFVTYTAANGIRPLDVNTEFATSLGNATDNVRLTSATSVDSAATANSLILSGAALSGAGTVNVTSGAVFLAASNSTISSGLNFGSAEGIVGYARGNTISGVVSGSGGLTVYGLRTDENLFLSNGASTYTGDTVILSNAMVATGFLPFDTRTGDVYVYGNLQLNVATYNGTINGLFGNGTVSYGNSGVSSLTIGDNNATSTFTGTIAGNSNLSVSKIGSGTLTFTGDHTYGRATSILGGTLQVATLADGGTASGIGQSASTASNLVIDGATLEYTGVNTSTDRLFQIGRTTDGGTATLKASGTGAVNFTNTGALTYGSAGTNTFARTRTLILDGSNTGNNTLAAAIGDNGTATNGNSTVSVTKNGAGTWVLSGASSYSGATTVNQGKLIIDGSIANSSGVNVAAGAVLGGHGKVSHLSGAGTIAPGNSPGILTAETVDGTDGLDFTFQFTLQAVDGLSTPDFGNAAASGNDVLRLTGADPFSGGLLNASNTITLDFSGLSLQEGDVYLGGFYTDSGDFLESFNAAQFAYLGLGSGLALNISTIQQTADFGAGEVNGYITRFEVVPEPGSMALFALSAVGLAAMRRRRNKAAA